MYFRPVFLPIAKGMVFCDAPGVGILGLDRSSTTASCGGRSIRWTGVLQAATLRGVND